MLISADTGEHANSQGPTAAVGPGSGFLSVTGLQNCAPEPTLTTTIQQSTGNPNQRNWARKRKSLLFGNEQSKIVFAGNIILNTENPEASTKKLLELINIVKL